MEKEDIIVMCEEAMDGYEEGGEKAKAEYLIKIFHEIRYMLIEEIK